MVPSVFKKWQMGAWASKNLVPSDYRVVGQNGETVHRHIDQLRKRSSFTSHLEETVLSEGDQRGGKCFAYYSTGRFIWHNSYSSFWSNLQTSSLILPF